VGRAQLRVTLGGQRAPGVHHLSSDLAVPPMAAAAAAAEVDHHEENAAVSARMQLRWALTAAGGRATVSRVHRKLC